MQRNTSALLEDGDFLHTIDSSEVDSYGAPLYQDAVLGGIERDKVCVRVCFCSGVCCGVCVWIA